MIADPHAVAEDRLRAVGRRYTTKRRALVASLAAATKPLAVPDLVSVSRGLPQSSLYRNLAMLEQAGVVHRVVTDEEFARYELSEDLTQHHHHLVCRSCGAVEDVLVPPTFERQVQRTLSAIEDRTGFSAVSHRLDLIGTCRTCGGDVG
ncbi:MAG TPA: Fur family transcriptional regulator [Actinomycetota bacterium]